MTNLSDMMKKVESEFENDQKRCAEAATKKQVDQALLKRLTDEQWEVLHSELEAKANELGQNTRHDKGMVQIGHETRLNLRVTREERGLEKMNAVYASLSRDLPAKDIVLVPSVVSGIFKWTAPGMENAGKSSADMAERLLKGLIEFHAQVLRAPLKCEQY